MLIRPAFFQVALHYLTCHGAARNYSLFSLLEAMFTENDKQARAHNDGCSGPCADSRQMAPEYVTVDDRPDHMSVIKGCNDGGRGPLESTGQHQLAKGTGYTQ